MRLRKKLVALLAGLLLGQAVVCASASPQDQTGPSGNSGDPTTIFPHPEDSRFWLSGQANVIVQGHPALRARYTGPNSLSPQGQAVTSRVVTLYTGVQLTPNTEFTFDLESTGGHGIGEALGLAGFTNLDVVRNPALGSKPYVARVMVRQIISLSGEKVSITRDPLSLATELPARRLEIRAGKFSLADFFDLNAVGSDSHLQFLNWTVDNNGAYDYAANTRGYTYGVILDFEARGWGLRFAETVMPKVANGIVLDFDVLRARASNLELELRRGLIPRRQGVLRLSWYGNQANMGDYREAIDAFLAGRMPVPDVTAHPFRTRLKYGFGANFQQSLNDRVRAFARWGWDEGHHESFAYTEVNETESAGVDVKGDRWRRKLDKVGAAFVVNAISGDHRRYLALGGRGFLLGDGALNYGRERILETYYTAHLWRGVFLSFDLQYVGNPGYNRDRGPVLVPAARLHLEL